MNIRYRVRHANKLISVIEINQVNQSKMQQPKIQKTKPLPSPEISSSIFGKIAFWWTTKIFRTGINRSIEESDIYEIPDKHKSQILSDEYSKLWDDELKRRKPSIIRLFMRIIGYKIIVLGFFCSNIETAVK